MRPDRFHRACPAPGRTPAARRALRLLFLLVAAASPALAEPRVWPAPPGWATVAGEGIVVHAPRGAEPLAGDLAGSGRALLREIEAGLGIPRPEDVVTVYLVNSPEADAAVEAILGAAPGWAAGYALRGRAVVVVRTRTRHGPLVSEVPEVFRHELVHVLVDRFLGGRSGEVPRWFHEGIATVYAHEGRFQEVSALARQAMTGPALPLAALDGVIASPASSPDSVRAAYVESFAFVSDLARRRGLAAAGGILRRVRDGFPFGEAFEAQTGETLAASEARWARSFRWRWRWIPILTSSLTLWILITTLVLVAGAVKRRRAAARLAQMRADDPWWTWPPDDPRVN